jgi:hypothetical protein
MDYFFLRFLPAAAILAIRFSPYFFLPAIAAIAAGFSAPDFAADFSTARNLAPLPSFAFLDILDPF